MRNTLGAFSCQQKMLPEMAGSGDIICKLDDITISETKTVGAGFWTAQEHTGLDAVSPLYLTGGSSWVG